MRLKTRQFCFGKDEDALLQRIKTMSDDAYIKRGTFSTEIIWGKKSFIFPSLRKGDYQKFKSGLFLFSKVRKEAKAFLKKRPNFRLPKEERSIIFNDDVPHVDVKVCGTDLNHAYWRIALNLGIISNATYEKGLPKNYKSLRLAALSTLGAGRTFMIISEGKVTGQKATFGGDEELKRVYKLIRFTCFKHMGKVRKMLGNDFLAYKTDCIYYIDTPENRKMVRDYFLENGLSFKQLS